MVRATTELSILQSVQSFVAKILLIIQAWGELVDRNGYSNFTKITSVVITASAEFILGAEFPRLNSLGPGQLLGSH